jgi:beta-lactamase class D
MRHWILFLILILSFHHLSAQEEEFLILETENDQSMTVQGNKNLLAQQFSPASTFKIIMAWASLEEGVVQPSTLRQVKDSHVPNTPRSISLKEALFFSSNDYFVWLYDQLGLATLTRYMERSEWIGKSIPTDWLGDDPKAVVRAGNLKVNPLQQHQFILKVMNGKLASADIDPSLRTALEWPSSNPKLRLFGKTGSWGDVVWFNGFGESDQGKKAVTVLIHKKGAKRDEGIQLFYSSWDQTPPKNP